MAVTAQTLPELRQRTSAKWRLYPDDVLPLFVAEMDYPLAEPIAEALHAAVRRSDTGYAVEDPELRSAFAGFALRRWGWQVDPDQVRTTTDVSMGIVEILRRVTEPGDGVIIMPPVYPPFFELLPEAGARVVEVPLLDTGKVWAIDLDGVERAFEAGAKALLLCNPHNPLGHPHPRGELGRIAELAERFGATVISDEIHGPLTHSDGHYVPFLTISDAAREHGVALTSASKGWNLAGLKCALMITDSSRMRAIIDGMPEEVFWRTSILGVHGAIAAYRHGEEWLDGVIESVERNRRLLSSLLAERMPAVVHREPRASYLAWLDLRALGWGDDPSAHILREARVALNPGTEFGAQGTGFVRLNYGCSPELLTEAIDRIAAIKLTPHD